MLRPILRNTTRATRPQAFHCHLPHARSRFISSTPPARRSRSWKSSAARWGLAAAGIYWYSTTAVFAEEPAYLNSTSSQAATEDESPPTLDTIASARKQRLASAAATTPTTPAPLDAPSPSTTPDLSMAASMAVSEGAASPASTLASPSQPSNSAQDVSPQTVATPAAPGAPTGSPAELEEEAEGEGAFNPETGEINWDCPCLGGMAHGPCGPEFREAFSCFVYSEQEPKGIDCIEKFKGMQDCFRSHPDVYGAELMDDNDEEDHEATQNATNQAPPSNPSAGNSGIEKEAKAAPETKVAQPPASDDEVQARRERAKAATQQVAQDYSADDSDDKAIPKAWHDATGDNEKK